MKHQTPNTKHQKSSKLQTPIVAYGEAQWSAEDWMLNEGGANGDGHRHPFDLEERTARFGEANVRFTKKITRHPTNDRLTGQLAGCGTSVGANYCEANANVSMKDFRNTIARCVKEAKETKFFLRMLAASEPQLADDARELYREAAELQLIFASMFRKTSVGLK